MLRAGVINSVSYITMVTDYYISQSDAGSPVANTIIIAQPVLYCLAEAGIKDKGSMRK